MRCTLCPYNSEWSDWGCNHPMPIIAGTGCHYGAAEIMARCELVLTAEEMQHVLENAFMLDALYPFFTSSYLALRGWLRPVATMFGTAFELTPAGFDVMVRGCKHPDRLLWCGGR